MYILIISFPLDDLKFEEVENEHLGEIVKNSIIIILAILAVRKFKLSGLAGLSSKSNWNSRYLTLIPLYLVLIGLTQVKDVDLTDTPPSSVVLFFISTLSIGFSEEFVFRGILQSLFLKEFFRQKQTRFLLFLSVFVPAFIFGLLHLLNFKVDDATSEISQTIYATLIGATFGAILLRTNKLIPLAIIHGLIDFVFNLDELSGQLQDSNNSKSIISAIATVVVVTPMFIAALYQLRKVDVVSIGNKITLSNSR